MHLHVYSYIESEQLGINSPLFFIICPIIYSQTVFLSNNVNESLILLAVRISIPCLKWLLHYHMAGLESHLWQKSVTVAGTGNWRDIGL